jgi:hypothetical protein
MNYSEGSDVTGEPFYKALKVSQKTAELLLDEIRKKGQLSDRLVELTELTPLNTLVSISGVATYDQNGSYLGANVMLRKVAKADPKVSTQERMAIVTDVRPVPKVQETDMEAGFLEHKMFVELYFTTHIRAMYVLMGRLVGLAANKNLDKIINTIASERQADVNVENGLFISDITTVDYETFRIVLSEVINYAVNVIGQRMVLREIQSIDAQMHPGVLQLATEAELVGLIG